MSPPALGTGQRSWFVAWISLWSLWLWGCGSWCLVQRGGGEGAHCISAACLEPSGANDFPRLLLRVGFEFPSQR